MFEAARAAGVKRIVHISILNPSLDSPLEYFNSKAVLEKVLIEFRQTDALIIAVTLPGAGQHFSCYEKTRTYGPIVSYSHFLFCYVYFPNISSRAEKIRS